VIEVKGLTKKYGQIMAVSDLSFAVNENQVLGLLGRNGAGKTTAMNMMAGYLPCTAGTVVVDGFDIHEDPQEVKKRIGYLPEAPPVYPEMTVKEYLAFVCGLKGVKGGEAERQMGRAMNMADIGHVSGRLIANLSKGYRQRVGLAQAVVGGPEIIILDEPTVGLDPKQIIEFRQTVEELGRSHIVILSSHILKEVADICSRVMIIDEGTLVADGSIETLIMNAQKTRNVVVRLTGEAERARKLFGQIPGVKGCGAVEAGRGEYTLSLQADQDVRAAVFSCAVAQRLPLVELKQQEMTLEELFINLTAAKDTKESYLK